MKNLLKIAATLCGLLFCFNAFAQIPPIPIDPFLDSWSFDDATNWTSDEGYLPIAYTNIDNVSCWATDDGILDCNALLLDSTNMAYLNYHLIENNGHTNLALTEGTIWFWFSPDWGSSNLDDGVSTGPEDWGRFVDVGAWTSNSTYGWWSLYVSPDGNNIYFSGQTNGVWTNYLNAPISWTANSWHLIGLTYTPTNSILYIDDQIATNGLGVTYWPGHEVQTNGFYLGSDYSGTQQARGQFVDFETWNIVFGGDEFSAYYDEMLPELPGGGFFRGFGGADFSPPPGSFGGSGGGGGLPDFDYGTNFWLYLAGIQTNTVGLFLVNTEPDVTYEMQSKTDLTLTNWNSEGFVLGSELTNYTEMDVAQGDRTNNLFFRAKSWASSDGSGLPDWWELEYFGTNGVDPYGNPEGDGWNNLQKFQNGMNPNVFYTPPAPQGVTAIFNGSNGVVNVSWLPSPGNVTGYTVTKSDYAAVVTTTFNVSVPTNSISDTVTDSPYFFLDEDDGFESSDGGPEIDVTYQIQAHYGSSGDSALSDAVALEPGFNSTVFYGKLPVSVVAGPQGSAYLAVSGLPAGTAAVRLSAVDFYAHTFEGNDSFDTNVDIPVSAFTNGVYLLPTSLTVALPDSYGYNYYTWNFELIDTSNTPSASQTISYGNYYTGIGSQNQDWMVSPYYDGRAQLKQNLIFLLRSPNAIAPFGFADQTAVVNNTYSYSIVLTSSNYAYADFSDASGVFPSYAPDGVFAPFANNNLYQNFVYSTANVNSGGAMTTGVGPDYYDNYYSDFGGYTLVLQEPWSHVFSPPSSGTAISALLATNALYAPPLSVLNARGETNAINISASTNSTPIWTLSSGAKNYWGLPYLSAQLRYGSGSSYTLSPGGSFQVADANVYINTAQPGFQLAEYDFNMAASPGSTNFSTTNTSNSAMIASVGSSYSVNAYAKLAVTNSAYSGVYGYLGQYFDKAYAISNGVVTTNTTGVLSAYGSFFPTEPGAAALVTMPDIDTGARGTGTVYSVSLNVDANHDGNMDLSFSGADATSQASPATVWVNDNYDRWKYDLLGLTNEQDDTEVAAESDCNYTTNGLPAIPCPRDLEDYFRLWTPGLATLMKVLPSNYTVRLALTGDGQIRIFQAVEANGGTNYLFDETTASNQVANSTSLYVGLLTSSAPIVFNVSTNFNEHFIFCGAQAGSAQIDLRVLDGNGNVVADAPTYLQINEIKQMYERWTVGDLPTTAPTSTAYPAVEGLPVGASAFQYTAPQDTNTPYILFVHGWNMEPWEKDRFAETTFKRLYWQGYHGRFGSFRWPTYYDFPLGSWSWQAVSLRNFDNSESNAWASAAGLLNKLNDLNAEYPNNVYLLAHSMGNVVAGEALRLAGTNRVVNTYAALQGAIASHAYDASTPTRALVTLGVNLDSGTPDCYANYYTNGAPSYFNSSAGAGTYVNFFNTNDWALTSLWEPDQNLKPDNGFIYPGYFYSVSSQHPNGFYEEYGSGTNDFRNLNFPGDTYSIFAYCDEARSHALGAQANVGGTFFSRGISQQVNLRLSPYNFLDNHIFHSGEFRSDTAQRAAFWNTVLVQMNLK